MNHIDISSYLSNLISIQSVTENELEALLYLEASLEALGWKVERIPVAENRYNLFFHLGTPRVLFTTHIDVVPALESQFLPFIKEGRVYGRGACDAKGVLSSMIFAMKKLVQNGHDDISLLVVVGEEVDGIGAIKAAQALKGREIEYIVNGEPTEGKLVSGHKGGVCFNIQLKGRSCHSGYPELGEDANKKLILLGAELINASWGNDPVLGKGTINLGDIKGGNANNIVSNEAKISGMIRTVGPNDKIINQLKEISAPYGELQVFYDAKAVTLKTLPGFETGIVSYCTDIPQLLPMGGEFLMYGPGSIINAHTVDESIGIDELEKAVDDFCRIYEGLS